MRIWATESDDSLLAEAAVSEEAFATLYQRWEQPLLIYFRRRTHDRPRARRRRDAGDRRHIRDRAPPWPVRRRGSPGAAGSGARDGPSLYPAVRLASGPPGRPFQSVTNLGSHLYLSGRGHSRICGPAEHAVPPASGPCYVAGPAPTLDSLVRS